MVSRRNAPNGRVFSASHLPGCLDFLRVVVEIGQAQRALEDSTVGMRVGAHAARAGGRQSFQFGDQAAVASNEFVGA